MDTVAKGACPHFTSTYPEVQIQTCDTSRPQWTKVAVHILWYNCGFVALVDTVAKILIQHSISFSHCQSFQHNLHQSRFLCEHEHACVGMCVCMRRGERERVCTYVETCIFMHQQHPLMMFLVYHNVVYLSYLSTEYLLNFLHDRFITVRHVTAVSF